MEEMGTPYLWHPQVGDKHMVSFTSYVLGKRKGEDSLRQRKDR